MGCCASVSTCCGGNRCEPASDQELQNLESKVVRHRTIGYEEETDQGTTTHEENPSLPSFTLQPERQEPGKFYYGLRIVTGNQPGASADTCSVVLSLTGDKGGSGEITVDGGKEGWGMFSRTTHFKKSTYDDLIIESNNDLGDILVVQAGLRYKRLLDIITPDWYIDFFTVRNFQSTDSDTQLRDYPCYHWIGKKVKDVTATSATATLQQVAGNPVLVQQRSNLLKERHETYEWQMFPDTGVPSAIDNNVALLPLDEQFERAKMINFLGNGFKGIMSSSTAEDRVQVLHRIEDILQMKLTESTSVANLHDFEFIATTLETENLKDADPPQALPLDPNIPAYEGYRWVSDVEFGRQILNGVNPVLIRRCNNAEEKFKMPDNFPVTNDTVKHLLNNGKSLEDEMAILHDLPTREGYYCPAPLCLLYVNGSKKLVPIAIQLMRDPGPHNPIFLPSDSWFEWLLAKMFYRSADAQYHQILTHYICCHASMEAYGVATMRNLPDAHPVYKLLQPHFRYTMAINAAARLALISTDGIIPRLFAIGSDGMVELFKRASTIQRVQWTNVNWNVKERGVENQEELPGYYYRDDGITMWNAIQSYAQEIICLFYKSDEDVKNDSELKEWVQEVHTVAFPGFLGAPQGHGFPDKIETIPDLVEYCTLIMFTGSAQHAAVNFGQFDTYGYVPNAPFGMRKPPPKHSSVLYRDVLEYLPDIPSAALGSSITFTLAQFSPDEIFLGGYPDTWFSESEAKNAVTRFVENLKKIDDDMRRRNKDLDVEYHYLCPSRVPNSITI